MVAMEITGNSILKPSQRHSLFNEHVPLTIFDRAAFDLNVPILYVYPPPVPENSAIKEGLQKALSLFPHCAGRLSTDNFGRRSILLNDAGVRVIETRISSNLQESLPLLPTAELQNFHPETEGVEELMQVQLNRYACGGLVLGLASHHRVCDGQSMNTFFTAWARLVNGLEIDPLPFHNRSAIAVPRNPRKIEYNHQEIEFRDADSNTGVSAEETHNVIIHYSVNFISKLKGRFQSGSPNRRCSTFQCLLTHVWKKLTAVRGVAGEEMTQVRVAVNGRARMKPRVPMGYFGNLVLWAYPRMTAEELLTKSYGEVAEVIHGEISKVDDGYFKSFIDFGEEKEDSLLAATAPEVGNSLSPNMEVDSWLSFQYHELDFGGGGPVQVLTYLPIEGLGILLPSPLENGAVDFHVALMPDHVGAFKKIAHELD